MIARVSSTFDDNVTWVQLESRVAPRVSRGLRFSAANGFFLLSILAAKPTKAQLCTVQMKLSPNSFRRQPMKRRLSLLITTYIIYRGPTSLDSSLWMATALFVVFAASTFLVASNAISCSSDCDAIPSCPGGYVLDDCNCSHCAQQEGDECDRPHRRDGGDTTRRPLICDHGLKCAKRHGVRVCERRKKSRSLPHSLDRSPACPRVPARAFLFSFLFSFPTPTPMCLSLPSVPFFSLCSHDSQVAVFGTSPLQLFEEQWRLRAQNRLRAQPNAKCA